MLSDYMKKRQEEKVFGKPIPNMPPVEKLVSIPELKKKAEAVFNKWIKVTKGNVCFTCGGRAIHAGHFVPVGENEAVRFFEDNVWPQCKKCNIDLRGNREVYRKELIAVLGLEKVIELETWPRFHKFERGELNVVMNKYRLK